eukprot:483469-Lingulodinium_polyedra.AAC.1
MPAPGAALAGWAEVLLLAADPLVPCCAAATKPSAAFLLVAVALSSACSVPSAVEAGPPCQGQWLQSW